MGAFTLVVTEGLLEVPVAQKLLSTLGINVGETQFIPKRGRNSFWRDADRYNRAARHGGPVLGLADLENEPCPSGLISRHLTHERHPAYVLRIAERMLESWLLADRRAIAAFLRISRARVPGNPDALPNPKQALVNLARQSRSRDIVEDLVPINGSEGVVGRGYVSRMTEFVQSEWRPIEAGLNSESLRRAIAAVQAVGA